MKSESVRSVQPMPPVPQKRKHQPAAIPSTHLTGTNFVGMAHVTLVLRDVGIGDTESSRNLRRFPDLRLGTVCAAPRIDRNFTQALAALLGGGIRRSLATVHAGDQSVHWNNYEEINRGCD